jgi:hypothetical protein
MKMKYRIKHIHYSTAVIVALISLFVQNLSASEKLPPDIKALVPAGYSLVSPVCTKNGNMGSISFVASKHIEARRSISNSEYHFDLFIKEGQQGSSSSLIKLQMKGYNAQLEQDIKSTRKSYSDNKSDNLIGYEPPKETKYTWGWGIIQKKLHHYMGAGSADDEIEYTANYHGLIVVGNTIKKFKLSINGIESSAEAEQWVKQATEKIEKIVIADIK